MRAPTLELLDQKRQTAQQRLLAFGSARIYDRARSFIPGGNTFGRILMRRLLPITLLGFTLAAALSIAPASALAAGGGASCVSTGSVDAKVGTDGSTCDADSDGSAKATANSKGDSTTFATVTHGDKATAVATDKSFADAESEGAPCPAKATAKHNGESEAFCFGNGGSATASASKLDSFASAESDAGCKTVAKATGTKSSSNATCSTPGGVVTVTTTNGGFAEGSDTDPPDCVPGPGTAKVRSTGGNCG
ncbi:MAG TPA: hypothetical protein VEU51_01430 [Candidatus Acidoferrales bacterium]|nr:hypothetical protein [Candidatus Acidoferrales bacterium]